MVRLRTAFGPLVPFSLLLASCGLGIKGGPIVEVTVTPAMAALPNGMSLQFVATGRRANGSTRDITSTATWSSSDLMIAKFDDPSAPARVRAMAIGSVVITATDDTGIAGTTTLTITPAVLASLAVTPPDPTIAVGTCQQFTATGTYTDNTTQDLTTAVTWSSADTGVATISNEPGKEGSAKGVAGGSTVITATDPETSISGSTTLTVAGVTLVSLAVTPPSPSIALGTGKQFTATGTYSDNSTQNLTDAVTWVSSDVGVATIGNAAGSFGLAASVAVGSTSITAIDPGSSISGSASLTVTPAALVSLAVTPPAPSIALGTSQQFAATGTYTDNSTQDLTNAVTWSSSVTAIATIGSNGLASSVAAGSTSITAIAPGSSISGSASLTVTPAVLVSVAVTPANPSVPLGIAQQFAATGTYTDNTTQNLTNAVTWSSSLTGVATISNAAGSQGRASSASVGSTSIVATFPGTAIAGSTMLAVTPAELVSLAVTPADPSIPLGTAQQFVATGTYTDSSTQNLTAAVTWSSADIAVATISNAAGSHGLATSAAVGGTWITAAAPGTSIAGSTSLAVTPAELVSLAVTPANPSIPLGLTQQFAATGTYTDSSTQDLTAAVTWSSSTTGVATISNAVGSQGLASSAAVGVASIIATDPGTSIAGSTLLDVTPAELVSLAVTPADPVIPVGTSQQFIATGTYTDNSTQDLTAAVTWGSSDIGVATISNAAGSEGLASGEAKGSTAITAIDPNTSIEAGTSLDVVQRVTFVAASTNGAVPGTLSLTIPMPAGTVEGDVMIASIAVRPNPNVTAPSGWTLVRRTNNTAGSANSLLVYWRLATASEPTGYTWTFSSSTGSAGGIASFRGVDATSPIEVEDGQATPDSLSHATPSIETSLPHSMIVTSHGYASANSWTPPAGMNEAYDVRSQTAISVNGMTLCGCWTWQAAAGATGAKTATASASADTGNTQILVLRRAP